MKPMTKHKLVKLAPWAPDYDSMDKWSSGELAAAVAALRPARFTKVTLHYVRGEYPSCRVVEPSGFPDWKERLYNPAGDAREAAQLIEQERISVTPDGEREWLASCRAVGACRLSAPARGDTFAVAAMRAYVHANFPRTDRLVVARYDMRECK